jgi:hypothetical protein
MKRWVLISVTVVFAMTCTAVSGAERAPLGKGNFALKLDYIVFTDSYFDRGGNQDDGLYVGLEGYGEILPNLYLGGEIGTATNVEAAGEEISFYPLELNLKYALKTAPNLFLDFGGGISYSYVELQYQVPFGPLEQKRNDWLFGGQVFMDLTYRMNWFSIGLNAKYQATEDFKGEDLDLNNFRVGVQMGIVF